MFLGSLTWALIANLLGLQLQGDCCLVWGDRLRIWVGRARMFADLINQSTSAIWPCASAASPLPKKLLCPLCILG